MLEKYHDQPDYFPTPSLNAPAQWAALKDVLGTGKLNKCELRITNGEEPGIYATEAIKNDEPIGEFTGAIWTAAEFDKMVRTADDKMLNTAAFQIPKAVLAPLGYNGPGPPTRTDHAWQRTEAAPRPEVALPWTSAEP